MQHQHCGCQGRAGIQLLEKVLERRNLHTDRAPIAHTVVMGLLCHEGGAEEKEHNKKSRQQQCQNTFLFRPYRHSVPSLPHTPVCELSSSISDFVSLVKFY